MLIIMQNMFIFLNSFLCLLLMSSKQATPRGAMEFRKHHTNLASQRTMHRENYRPQVRERGRHSSSI